MTELIVDYGTIEQLWHAALQTGLQKFENTSLQTERFPPCLHPSPSCWLNKLYGNFSSNGMLVSNLVFCWRRMLVELYLWALKWLQESPFLYRLNMSSHPLLMLATPLVNIEDYLDPPAFVDVSEELKQESWQLLIKLSLRLQTILKLPYRLSPLPLSDVTQLSKLFLPAQPELWLVLSYHHGPVVQADPPRGPLEVLLRQIQGRQFVTDTFCPDRDLRRKEKMKKEEKNEKQI